MPTAEDFRNWLVERGNPGAATTSYPGAINMISEHYSEATATNTDIYAISEQGRISEIAHDYRQAGRFSEFGYRQHGRFRAAIQRYAEFFSQHHGDGAGLEPAPVPLVEPDDADAVGRNNFAYERDLRTTLCAQVSELFPGYRIFGDSSLGVEYAIGDRRIDVLLEHEGDGRLLVLELKSSVADYRAFGQISMYIGLLQVRLPEKKVWRHRRRRHRSESDAGMRDYEPRDAQSVPNVPRTRRRLTLCWRRVPMASASTPVQLLSRAIAAARPTDRVMPRVPSP
jgi:hypothetical protein